MKQLETGRFYGNTFNKLTTEGITITETEYTHEWVDWHYHENAYFTYILHGSLIEGSRKEKNICGAGTLLYHNCQEPHYNIKPAGYSRGFHIEIPNDRLRGLELSGGIEGKYCVNDPQILKGIRKIYSEFRNNHADTGQAIEECIVDVFGFLQQPPFGSTPSKPSWVPVLNNILSSRFHERLTLQRLSAEIGIHPVHLSRDFKKHFNSTLSGYIRKLKLQHALKFISSGRYSYTHIAHECGFADQSHFLRWFKAATGLNPSAYKTKFPKC